MSTKTVPITTEIILNRSAFVLQMERSRPTETTAEEWAKWFEAQAAALRSIAESEARP